MAVLISRSPLLPGWPHRASFSLFLSLPNIYLLISLVSSSHQLLSFCPCSIPNTALFPTVPRVSGSPIIFAKKKKFWMNCESVCCTVTMAGHIYLILMTVLQGRCYCLLTHLESEVWRNKVIWSKSPGSECSPRTWVSSTQEIRTKDEKSFWAAAPTASITVSHLSEKG